MPSDKATNTIFIVFGFTKPELKPTIYHILEKLKPTIYHILEKHTNNYTTYVVSTG
jgi:hypothetical protein